MSGGLYTVDDVIMYPDQYWGIGMSIEAHPEANIGFPILSGGRKEKRNRYCAGINAFIMYPNTNLM